MFLGRWSPKFSFHFFNRQASEVISYSSDFLEVALAYLCESFNHLSGFYLHQTNPVFNAGKTESMCSFSKILFQTSVTLRYMNVVISVELYHDFPLCSCATNKTQKLKPSPALIS